MCDDRGEISDGIKFLFDCLHEAIQATKAVEFLFVIDLRRVERGAQNVERLVVSLQGHRKRVPILTAVRERETRRIREATRCAVYHFRAQSKRLKRSRS